MTGHPDFAARLLAWFDASGRHDLPWQLPRSPYRVWLSEVMLQQTQVATVVPYFLRFIAALPDLRALAAAPDDQVLALWSGLGYYSRARNLQRAARLCVERHGGQLPDTLVELRALPGIGRSTAGAILALAFGQRAPILDGNVRRVLIRHRAIEGDPLSPPVQMQLWNLSDALLPSNRIADYTQAIMDLGATVCTRARPRCVRCPVGADCVASLGGLTNELPRPRRRPTRTQREYLALVLRDGTGRLWLERRTPTGVWGGLWSLPEFPDRDALHSHLLSVTARLEAHCDRASSRALAVQDLDPVRHAFTHFDLTLRPTLADIDALACAVAESDARRWFAAEELDAIGLPAPIRKLLTRLPEATDAT